MSQMIPNSNETDAMTDDELMEEFTAMIRRDAATITDPDELAAMHAVVAYVMGDDNHVADQADDQADED